MKRAWLIQFFGNALLIFLFYEWLGIRDSRVSQLLLSFLLGLAIFAGAVLLHSRTFHVKPLKFAALLVIFLLCCWALSFLPLQNFSVWLASTLTFRSRTPVNPATVFKVLDDIRWAIQWLSVPILLLRTRKSALWIPILVFAGFALPNLLIHWTPKLESTASQVTSFVLRFGFAYCLTVTTLAAFARFTSPGKPLESQPSTAALP